MIDLPHQSKSGNEPVYYEIRIKGILEKRWCGIFEKMTITIEEDQQTCLSGPVADQAALYGLLRKVQDLGMTLLSVGPVDTGESAAEASK